MSDTVAAGEAVAMGIAPQRVHAEGFVSAKPESLWPDDPALACRPSVIDKLYQQGSARIRFPDTATGPLQAVLLNTAGGLAGDDNILWAGSAEDQAHLSISTAACEKIYRSHGTDANQTTRLNLGYRARLDWLPQESILFNGACLKRTMDVQLVRLGASVLPSRLVVRVLAADSYQLKKFLIPCLELLNNGRPVPAVWKV